MKPAGATVIPAHCLPGPAVIRTALRTTTECLAGQLAGSQHQRPDWSDFEWNVARAVTAMHGVSALLAVQLSWSGPPSWQQFLDEQSVHIQRRDQQLRALLVALDRAAQSSGVALVALKGAELYARGLYVAGHRPMADIDLLVAPAQEMAAAQLLGELGFIEAFASERERSFVQPDARRAAGLGEHAANPLKIELHIRVGEALPVQRVDLTHRIFPQQVRGGLNSYRSPASLMAHLLLHAAGAMTTATLRLLHLHDIAALSRRMNPDDWRELLSSSSADGGYWWAAMPLTLTARYYQQAIPAQPLSELQRLAPRLLRWLHRRRGIAELSLSNPRIYAFPGIEWSQSLGEAARYVTRRVRPDAQQREQRRHLAATEIGLASSPWRNWSQTRRALQWVFARPGRPATMHAVRSACETLQPGNPRIEQANELLRDRQFPGTPVATVAVAPGRERAQG
jgi:hypothetical protein